MVKWDFFLAHAGTDITVAEAIYDLLKQNSRPFLDCKCLKLGCDWDKELAAAQKESLITVVLISAKTEEAYYQREEIATAITLARKNPEIHRVIPVYLDSDVAKSNSVPYGLCVKHGITLSTEVGYKELAEKLLSLLRQLQSLPPLDLTPKTNLLNEPNTYISRPALESRLMDALRTPASDGSIPRLVTLHASGGMGKTRLSRNCGLSVYNNYKRCVFFVDLLGKKKSKRGVAEAIGMVLGMTVERSAPKNLLEDLKHKDMLLILDNYESVDSNEVKGYIEDLITKTDTISLLVTGRKPVGLSNYEQIIGDIDEGMDVKEARELFIARARLKTNSNWKPAKIEEESLNKIISLTERIPLAIELTAALTDRSTLEEIATGLERTALIGAPTDIQMRVGRHNSLTHCLDWSYNLLEKDSKERFLQLGIFPDSFTTVEAEEICALLDVQTLLDNLKRNALIHRIKDVTPPRYAMHRATREYAETNLKKNEKIYTRIKERFVKHFTTEVERMFSLQEFTIPRNKNIKESLTWMETEWRNVNYTIRLAIAEKNWHSLRIFSDPILTFFLKHGHLQDGETICTDCMEVLKNSSMFDSDINGYYLNMLGVIFQFQGKLEKAEGAFSDSLKIRKDLDRAKTLNSLGRISNDRNKLHNARKYLEESLAICKNNPDWLAEKGKALNNLARVYFQLGLQSEATTALTEALSIFKDMLHDREGEADTYNQFGLIAEDKNDWENAEEYFRERLALLVELDDNVGQARTLNSIGWVLEQQNKLEEAQDSYNRALVLCVQASDRSEEEQTKRNLAHVNGCLASANLPLSKP